MKLLAVFLILGFSIEASELVVNTSSGNDYYLEVGPEDSFDTVLDLLQFLEKGEKYNNTGCVISFSIFDNKFKAMTKSSPTTPRNYYTPLTQTQKETIHQLLTTLAYSSLIKIGIKRSSLTKLGDNIENLHPLKFLGHVFSNDELLVAIRNIRSRMIWKEFIDPVLESLQKESSLHNITSDQINDLAANVKVDANLIATAIYTKNWNELIETLLLQAPRSNDAKRYDM